MPVYEAFDLSFRDDRSATPLSPKDGMFSPRIGFAIKPDAFLSVCRSYRMSFDCFATLNENNNIQPGAPPMAKASLSASF